MPKVGGRQFGYSKKEKTKAASYAKKTGKKITRKRKGASKPFGFGCLSFNLRNLLRVSNWRMTLFR